MSIEQQAIDNIIERKCEEDPEEYDESYEPTDDEIDEEMTNIYEGQRDDYEDAKYQELKERDI